MKKIIFSLCLIVVLHSCFQNQTENTGIIYSDFNTSTLYQGTDILFSTKDKQTVQKSGYSMAVNYLYDSYNDELWISSEGKSNTIILFQCGEKEFIQESIHIAFNDRPFICGIYNNTLLNCIDSSNAQYELISIDEQSRRLIEIRCEEILLLPIGFSGDKIYFNDGYFDLNEHIFHTYAIELRYKRIVGEDICIGLNNLNEIVLYHIDSKQITNTGIHRNLDSYARYSPDNLYFFKDNILYYSEDFLILPIIRRLFPIWYTRTTWKTKNLTTGEISQIQKIHKQCRIIGISK